MVALDEINANAVSTSHSGQLWTPNYLNAMGIEYKEVDGEIDCGELTRAMFLHI